MSIIWQCLAYSNSCVNPVIYNHTSKDFRDAFRGAFSTRRRLDSTGRRLDLGAAGGSTRVGQQRPMMAVTGADDAGIARTNLDDLQQQQQQHSGVNDVDNLSDCSDRVHLED